MQDKVEFDHMIIIYDHMISLCIISYDAFWLNDGMKAVMYRKYRKFDIKKFMREKVSNQNKSAVWDKIHSVRFDFGFKSNQIRSYSKAKSNQNYHGKE